MINNLRFELSFKNISQLENKLNFCKFNKIKNINIPCKGIIKKDFFNSTIKYISKNYTELNPTYHYSLYHQYSQNKEKSYQDFLGFLNKSYSNKNYEVLLVSGSNKKKNFDVINVLSKIKEVKNLKVKLGIAYNPYLKKYNKETNATICLTSHYMKDITSLCKRVICVHEGTVSYDGKLDLLLKKLSPVKEILIVCSSEEDATKLENSGFTVKNKIKNEITLKIENNSITSSLKNILNNFDIEDLFINEPPIDEVIGKVLIKKDYDI